MGFGLWKVLVVTLLTSVVFFMLATKPDQGIGDLTKAEIVDIFVAVPVLTLAYYWLISSKVSDFEEKLESVEKKFERVESEFELDEKVFEKFDKELDKDESTLKNDIRELKAMVGKLHKDVQVLKRK